MSLFWRKVRALFVIYFQDSLAYRASGFLWILTDLVQCLIMPMVWLAAYNGRSELGGYHPAQMVMYYLMVALTSNFVVSHLMWDVAYEIKEGLLSQWLVRPFPFLWVLFVRNLSWRVVRTFLFLPMLGLCILYYRSYFDLSLLRLEGWWLLSLVLGHLVSFFSSFMLANLAFWLQETYSVFGLYYIPMLLLSGWVAPLGLTPGWLQWLAAVLPFRYTTAVPVEIALGKLTSDALGVAILGQFIWAGLGLALGWVLWRKGLHQYTGVGM